MPTPRARAWCITINNPTDDDKERMRSIKCVYIVYQEEKGTGGLEPDKPGTRHIQGYVAFKSLKTRAQVLKMLPRASLRIADGDAKQNTIYCSKADTRVAGGVFGVRGVMPDKGKRVDIEEMMESIVEGMNDLQMFEKYGVQWHQYRKTLQAYRINKKHKRCDWTKTLTIWGPTGTGKSHRAHRMAKELDEDYGTMMVQEKGRAVWADGCENAKVIVLEDFEGEIPLGVLKQMLDKYPCRVPVKGGSMIWNAQQMIITSNKNPRDWYPNVHNDQDDNYLEWEATPLYRRLTTEGSKIEHRETKWIAPVIVWQDEDAQPPLRDYDLDSRDGMTNLERSVQMDIMRHRAYSDENLVDMNDVVAHN